MLTQRLSVRQLTKYWEYIENNPTEKVEVIHTWCMPPWDDVCTELNWNIHMVGRGAFTKENHGYCGVYRVFGLATDNVVTKPATINRAFGADTNGTLYIGKADWCDLRLNQFRRSLGAEGSHKAASRLQQCSFLTSAFPEKRLGVGVFPTSVSMAGLIESDLIRAYLNTFGDTPPLNCSF
jgi:hypothetical protein